MPKFEKGQSGNPAGRPKGSVSHKKFRELIVKDALQIIASMIEKAKAGDTAAAKLLLDRVMAPMKAGDSFIQLPLNGDLTDDSRLVMQAIGAMQITASQGQDLLQAISSMARIVEIDDLEKRVAKLESRGSQCHPLSERLKGSRKSDQHSD
jgi:hypothetical protein